MAGAYHRRAFCFSRIRFGKGWVRVFVLGMFLCCVQADGQSPDTVWTRIYGWPGHDYLLDVQTTADGGILVAGRAEVVEADPDAYIAKLTNTGDTLWTWHTVVTNEAWAIREAPNSDIAFCGSYGSSVVAGRLSSDGGLLWMETYPQFWASTPFDLCLTDDGGMVMACYNPWPSPFQDALLLKVNSVGGVVWSTPFGGRGFDRLHGLQPASDGGYYACGWQTVDIAPIVAGWLIKVSEDGDSLWTRQYVDSMTYFYDLLLAEGDTCILIGKTWVDSTDFNDVLIMTTDPGGNELVRYQYTLPGVDEAPIKAIRTMDGGILVCGDQFSAQTSTDELMLKVDMNMQVDWWYSLDYALPSFAGSVCELGVGEMVVVGGVTLPGHWDFDLLVQRLSENLGTAGPPTLEPDRFALLPAYPNPFNSRATLTLHMPREGRVEVVMYDVLGRAVQTVADEVFTPGEHAMVLDGTRLSAGIYFVRSASDQESRVQKVILLR